MPADSRMFLLFFVVFSYESKPFLLHSLNNLCECLIFELQDIKVCGFLHAFHFFITSSYEYKTFLFHSLDNLCS